MRELAKYYEHLPEAVEGMRQAAKDGAFFQYRDSTTTRKHRAIDISSCSAAVAVWDALRPDLRERYIAKFGNNPSRFALIAWKFVK